MFQARLRARAAGNWAEHPASLDAEAPRCLRVAPSDFFSPVSFSSLRHLSFFFFFFFARLLLPSFLPIMSQLFLDSGYCSRICLVSVMSFFRAISLVKFLELLRNILFFLF